MLKGDSINTNEKEYYTIIAYACIFSIPFYCIVTGLNIDKFWTVVFCIIAGVGLACGLFGTIKRTGYNRVIPGLAVILMVCIIILFIYLSHPDR
jgi:hypothetical protein